MHTVDLDGSSWATTEEIFEVTCEQDDGPDEEGGAVEPTLFSSLPSELDLDSFQNFSSSVRISASDNWSPLGLEITALLACCWTG